MICFTIIKLVDGLIIQDEVCTFVGDNPERVQEAAEAKYRQMALECTDMEGAEKVDTDSIELREGVEILIIENAAGLELV